MRFSGRLVGLEWNEHSFFPLAGATGKKRQSFAVYRKNFKGLFSGQKNDQAPDELKMKILFYNHTGQVCGAEHILLLILKYLDQSRFTPFALCPAEGDLQAKLTGLGIPLRSVNTLNARFTLRPDHLLKYLISFFQTIKQIRKEILAERPDLIHANGIRSGLVATSATFGTRIPVFWHLHDELKKHPLSTGIRLFVLSSKRIRLISVSKDTARSFYGKLLQTFGKRIPLKVVYNAVETEKFRYQPVNRKKIREELGLSENEYVLGIVGQITPRKGQLELIRTFARTLKDHPRSTLLIVGKPMFNQDHRYLRQIKTEIATLKLEKRVRLLGFRSDIPAVMQSLDTLVVNSRSEAFVVVAIESMASGTPVITTDVDGMREMIRDGENGLIVPFGDEKKLTDSIIELAANKSLRNKFAARGRRFVTEELNARKFIVGIESFFVEAGPVQESETQFINSEGTRKYV
jgi:glycosyltransferase involved in cell wall biosynthesis